MSDRSWAPELLLLDHPCLPRSAGGAPGGAVQGDVADTRRDRLRCAIQLLAVSSILAEVELWPSRRSILAARSERGEHGPRMVLGDAPLSLARLYERIGGGGGARRLRDRLVVDVCRRCRLPLDELLPEAAEPGFLLDPVLERAIERGGLPLDATTAEALWAVAWSLPPLPEAGEVVGVPTCDLRQARRLAAAAAATLLRRGEAVRLEEAAAAGDDGRRAVASAAACLLVVGELGEEAVVRVDRWMAGDGARALVIGQLRPGWPSRVAHPPWRLVLVGGSRERCQRAAELRAHDVDPAARSSRRGLTEAARTLFSGRPAAVAGTPRATPASPLARLLALAPEGLPEGLLGELAGLDGERLAVRCEMLGAVRSGSSWRLEPAVPMVRDPFHGELARALPEDDPRALRHRTLAGDDGSALAAWCADRNRELAGSAVRALLAWVEPRELPEEVLLALLEAQLMDLDLGGARIVLAELRGEARAAWEAWLDCLDPPPGWRADEDVLARAGAVPAAAAAVAVRALRAAADGSAEAAAAAGALAAALAALAGAQRAWFEIEAASALAPERLEQREWRRAVAGRSPGLRRHALHKLALRLQKRDATRAAERILRRLARHEQRPGHLALICFDLGSVADQGGHSAAAFRDLSRSLRLLQAAGFQHRMRVVEFNLAVMDTDHLRVRSAEDHLEQAAGLPDDGFLLAERARLALARGREAELRAAVAELGPARADDDPRWREALSLLAGVVALFDRDLGTATRLLADGGSEGRQWLAVAAAVAGRGEEQRTPPPDPWGLDLAAQLVRATAGAAPPPALPRDGQLGLAGSLALALCRRLVGSRAREQRQLPWRQALTTLRAAGLDGWAELLAGDLTAPGDVVRVLARVAGGVDLRCLDSADLAALLAGLGVGGLEIRSADDGACWWRAGEGEEVTATRSGRLVLAALGHRPLAEHAWQLLGSLLDLTLPASLDGPGDDVGATGLAGVSAAVVQLRANVTRLAPLPVPVLLLGETGVGKEVVATALHRLSGRPGQLRAVNMAAIPDTLFEAELYGAERGAFTGADRRRQGLADAADHGTLFLDEIGDLSPLLQVKLLRFLESSEVRPVGSDRAHAVDVRIVAATHRDLTSLVAAGQFRQDLYFRIATFPLAIPPLRERREDIPVLRERFERSEAERIGWRPRRWSAEAEAALLAYPWPGNVRELRNAVTAAVINAGDGQVAISHLPPAVADGAGDAGGGVALPQATGTWDGETRRFQRELLQATLARTGGNRSAAARELGISRQALLYQLKRLSLAGHDDGDG